MELPKDKLTEEEIQALFKEYEETKNIDARNQLVNQLLICCHSLLQRQFSGRGIEYEDLMQVASLAL